MYSSIKGEGFVLLKIEQLQHIIQSSMNNRGTLIQQSLQNPNRQIVQSCIPNLEGINFIIKHQCK